MLILLPPSEGKTGPKRGKALDVDSLSFPGLAAAREQVLQALIDLSGGDPVAAATTLGLSAGQRDLLDLNATLRTAPTARADQIYTGVLYDALDVASLSTAARRRATSRVAIASSLFGLVRLTDRIPAYRLSGDASLPGVGGIAAHWRAALPEVARETVGRGLLIDLRSGMYVNFWRPEPDLAAQVATVRVLHEVDGTRKVVSHFNKATKGRLVRELLETGASPRNPQQLAAALRDLGWLVEVGQQTPKGTQLDVVVSDL